MAASGPSIHRHPQRQEQEDQPDGDGDGGKVRFSAILDWYEEDFLAVAPSLIAYANRYRDEPIPEHWEVGFLDYDWTLNAKLQPPSTLRP